MIIGVKIGVTIGACMGAMVVGMGVGAKLSRYMFFVIVTQPEEIIKRTKKRVMSL